MLAGSTQHIWVPNDRQPELLNLPEDWISSACLGQRVLEHTGVVAGPRCDITCEGVSCGPPVVVVGQHPSRADQQDVDVARWCHLAVGGRAEQCRVRRGWRPRLETISKPCDERIHQMGQLE